MMLAIKVLGKVGRYVSKIVGYDRVIETALREMCILTPYRVIRLVKDFSSVEANEGQVYVP